MKTAKNKIEKDLIRTGPIAQWGDTREWVVHAPGCPPLCARGIRLAGISDAGWGYDFVGPRPDVTVVLACTSGCGEAFLEGRWQPCPQGMAFLIPRATVHAYRALRKPRWGLCWVILNEKPTKPSIAGNAPVLRRTNPEPLESAIRGLYREVNGANEPAVVNHWVELIHVHTLRIIHPQHHDERLRKLWELVESDLARPWDLAGLAQVAHVSKDYLRVLCVKELGCAPMQHVAILRMRRAAAIIDSSDRKIEDIARAVGYGSMYSFSDAFHRCMGMRPSNYRINPTKGRSR